MAICGFCARSCGSCANCESPLRLYQSKSDGTPWARWVVGAVPGNSVLAFVHLPHTLQSAACRSALRDTTYERFPRNG